MGERGGGSSACGGPLARPHASARRWRPALPHGILSTKPSSLGPAGRGGCRRSPREAVNRDAASRILPIETQTTPHVLRFGPSLDDAQALWSPQGLATGGDCTPSASLRPDRPPSPQRLWFVGRTS